MVCDICDDKQFACKFCSFGIVPVLKHRMNKLTVIYNLHLCSIIAFQTVQNDTSNGNLNKWHITF